MDRQAYTPSGRDSGGGSGARDGDRNQSDVAIVIQDGSGTMRVVYIPARYASSMDPAYINSIVASKYGDEWAYVPSTEDGGELYASPTAHEGSYSGQMGWLRDQVQTNNAPIMQSQAVESAMRGPSDPDPMYGNPALHASPTDVVAKDPVTGAPITDQGWRTSRDEQWRAINSPGVDANGNPIPGTPMPQSDVYGNAINPYDVTGVQGPANMTPQEMAQANRTRLPANLPQPGAPGTGGTGNGLGDQPYTMTGDNVELNSMFNRGANSQDIANYYKTANNLDGSISGDFASNYWDHYDDIWALQNPGMNAAPGQMDMYNNTAQFMGDMRGNGEMVGTLDGYGLWDAQFSDQYMQSERAKGTGETWDDISTSQYNQVITNIEAMTPHMGTNNAKMIAGMVSKAYDDYRQISLTGTSMDNMTFIQYLQSIGAEDWF